MWTGVVLLVLLSVGAMVSMIGRHQGVEFSPYTFERRTYSYIEVPLIHWQCTANRRTTLTNKLETKLRSDSLVRPLAKDESRRWDLLASNRFKLRPGDTDASILCAYLDLVDERGLIWLRWTKEHPKLAAELWPRVQLLAKDQLYIYTPALFTAARLESDPDKLSARLNAALAESYLSVATSQQEQGRHASALEFSTKALEHDPNNLAALETRVALYKLIGEDQKAQADQAKIKKVRQRQEV